MLTDTINNSLSWSLQCHLSHYQFKKLNIWKPEATILLTLTKSFVVSDSFQQIYETVPNPCWLAGLNTGSDTIPFPLWRYYNNPNIVISYIPGCGNSFLCISRVLILQVKLALTNLFILTTYYCDSSKIMHDKEALS